MKEKKNVIRTYNGAINEFPARNGPNKLNAKRKMERKVQLM